MNDGHRTSTIPRPRVHTAARSTPTAKRSDTKRSDTKRATSVAADSDDDDRTGRIRDFTTPIARSKQLVPQPRGRLVLGLFGTLIALAVAAALFVLPVQSWFKQRDDLKIRTSELDTLNRANDQLQTEVDRLQTDTGIKEAARSGINYVDAGEQRITVLPVGKAPVVLPPGWPFDQVTQIIAIREAQATAATAVPAPTTTP